MKINKIEIIIAVVFFIVLNSNAQSIGVNRVIKEVTFSGSGYELGFQHGKTGNKTLRDSLEKIQILL